MSAMRAATIPAAGNTPGTKTPLSTMPKPCWRRWKAGRRPCSSARGSPRPPCCFAPCSPAIACWRPGRCTGACAGGCSSTAAGGGLATHFYDNGDLADLERLTNAQRPRLVWIETPANPAWDLQDIASSAEIAHRCGAAVAVDSTVGTPVSSQPLRLDAGLVMHSATKYLNGHSDVVAGAFVTREADALWQRIRYLRGMEDAILGSLEAWLLMRGMRTLYLRVPRGGGKRAANRPPLRRRPAAAAGAVPRPGLPPWPRDCRETDAGRLWSHAVLPLSRR